jgi:serine/threonine protein kinase
VTGQTLSHYRVIEKLGEGASAAVYLAEDLVLGRAVVLKLLRPTRTGDDRAAERFLHEARTASSLNHPNICTIHEVGEDGGRLFIVMERLDGRTLADLIADGPLAPALIADLAAQLADALDAAHVNGILHRDLKPQNVIVTRRGQAVLLDFGIAMLVEPVRRAPGQKTGEGATLGRWGGTLAYMSPEQLRGEELDARSDLFSMGSVLHEMATGQPAFNGADPTTIATAILSQTPQRLRTIAPHAPSELERIVSKALESNRQLRYQTAGDLRADLQRLRRDLDVAASHPQATSTRRATWRRPTLAAAAALGAVAITGLALAGAQNSGAPIPEPPVNATPRPVTAEIESAPLVPFSEPTSPVVRTPTAPPAPKSVPSANAPAAGVSPQPAPEPVESGSDPVAETAAPDPDAPMREELRVAQAQLAHRLDDQAVATLREAVLRHGAAPTAIDGYFLMASIQERQKLEDAMATYVQIADRFPAHARAPEALFRLASATQRSRRPTREADARQILTGLVARYASSPWALRALAAKADVEEREEIAELDPVLGVVAPAAIATWRRVLERDDAMAESEDALWRLGALYDRIKRYDLAAEAWSTLAERYPATRHDAWASAARLYERRLKDPEKAKAAWARVPETSPHYKDAQKRVRK